MQNDIYYEYKKEIKMNSPDVIHVIIEDDDFYFSAGLKFILKNFFTKNNKNVIFSLNERADILIRPENNSSLNTGGKEIIINGHQHKAKNNHRACSCRNILFKYDTIERFTILLKETLTQKATKNQCIMCRRTLTRREKQILYKFSEGLSSSEIAGCIGLNVKSVSQHKRNAMRKLSLRNTKELLLWLTFNKDELDI